MAHGKEAGGLVAHDDGFALLTNEPMPSGTPNAPPNNTAVAVLYRYTLGKETFKTFLGGPSDDSAGASCSPRLNGDLVYSEDAGMYGAAFTAAGYAGAAKGHSSDSLQYVNENGTITKTAGAADCSRNSGIALEASDSVPFASVCADNKGTLYLNNGAGMNSSRVKIGAATGAMGGASGSYSHLTRFFDTDSYIFTWMSRGAKDSSANRNVAVATSQKAGNMHVTWMTAGKTDCQNARVATFDSSNAIVSWEEIAEGKFTGTYFQQIRDGKKIGKPIKSTNVYVAGDMVNMGDGRVCWPYVNMAWSLDGLASKCPLTKVMSFACMTLDQNSAGSPTAKPSASAPPNVSYTSSFPVETPALSPSAPPASDVPYPSGFPVGTPSILPSAPAGQKPGGYGPGNGDKSPSAAPKPTFDPLDGPPRPYETFDLPASLSFNPSLAPAFTNIFPGLPGEFTTPPTYPTATTLPLPGWTRLPSTLQTRTSPNCSSATPTPTSKGSYY
ncbi:hypothetical protein ACJQWK_03103 [Exserohilum turcicum]